MKLVLLPRNENPFNTTIPDGMTHAADAPCPFGGEVLTTHTGTCCSFDATAVAINLEALGQERALVHLLDTHGEVEIDFVSQLLRATAASLERGHSVADRRATESSTDTVLNTATGAPFRLRGPWFKEAITSLRQAAEWYEKVGRLGCGAYPWYSAVEARTIAPRSH